MREMSPRVILRRAPMLLLYSMPKRYCVSINDYLRARRSRHYVTHGRAFACHRLFVIGVL